MKQGFNLRKGLTRALAARRADATAAMMGRSPHWPSAGSPSSPRAGRIHPKAPLGRWLYLDKDILPKLGLLALADIGRPEVLAVLRQIEAREALNIASKVRGWLNDMFRFAVVEGTIGFNPAADLEVVAMPTPPVRNNPFLRKDELPEFLRALRGAKVRDYTRCAIELLPKS